MSKGLAVVSALCISISLLLLILILVNKWDNLFFIISGTFALAGVIAGGIAGAPVAKAGMVSVYKYISKPKFTSVTPFENTTVSADNVSAFNGVAVDEGDRPQRLRQRAQVPLRQRKQHTQQHGLPGMPEISEFAYNGISENNKKLIDEIKNKGYWDLETDRFEPEYRHNYIGGDFMNALLKAMSDNNKIKFKFYNIIGTFSYHTSDSETPMTRINMAFEGTLSWGDIIDFTIFDNDYISARAHNIPPPLKIDNLMYHKNEALMLLHDALLLALGGNTYLEDGVGFNNSLLLKVIRGDPPVFIGYGKEPLARDLYTQLADYDIDTIYDKVWSDYTKMGEDNISADIKKYYMFYIDCMDKYASRDLQKIRLSDFLWDIYQNSLEDFDKVVHLIFNFHDYPGRTKPKYQVLYERIMPTVTPPTATLQIQTPLQSRSQSRSQSHRRLPFLAIENKDEDNKMSGYNKNLINTIKNRGYWDLETDRFKPVDYSYYYTQDGGFMNMILNQLAADEKIKFKFHNIEDEFSYYDGWSEGEDALTWDNIIKFYITNDTIRAQAMNRPPTLEIDGEEYDNDSVLMLVYDGLLSSLGVGGVPHLRTGVMFDTLMFLITIGCELKPNIYEKINDTGRLSEADKLADYDMSLIYADLVGDMYDYNGSIPPHIKQAYGTLFKTLENLENNTQSLRIFLTDIYNEKPSDINNVINLIFKDPYFISDEQHPFQKLYHQVVATM
jgi:hypothetical protein